MKIGRVFLAGLLALVMVGSAFAAASFVLTNTGRNMAATGFIGASPGGLNAGTIELQDASNNVLATLTLPNPVGTASNGVLTFGTIADATATGGGASPGTACTQAVVKNTAGTAIGTANVGTTGTSVIISAANISTGDTVHVTGTITLTVPAGT